MRRPWTPSIVPTCDDQNVYIVVDDFGRAGRSYRETDVEHADLETTIANLITGEYRNPIRVVAFNTAERCSEDVSEDVAREIRRRFDQQAGGRSVRGPGLRRELRGSWAPTESAAGGAPCWPRSAWRSGQCWRGRAR
jgi:hypothetical protein